MSSVADALFTLPEGDAVLGQNAEGALVVVLTDSENPDPAANPQELQAVTTDLTSQLQSDLLGLYGNALQAKFGVTVNDGLVEQIVNQTY